MFCKYSKSQKYVGVYSKLKVTSIQDEGANNDDDKNNDDNSIDMFCKK